MIARTHFATDLSINAACLEPGRNRGALEGVIEAQSMIAREAVSHVVSEYIDALLRAGFASGIGPV